MDSGIGNITAALKKAGVFEKTLIVFSAGALPVHSPSRGKWTQEDRKRTQQEDAAKGRRT
jgi:hypothetical protein